MKKNHEFGYHLLRIMLQVITERLGAARLKLSLPGGKPFEKAEGG